ncbi:MAG: tryptophan-rich sensory protein [Candidatus Levybacteria bacterium]|nr:tryptophan-rich sensory protein [Candidatus Levybacteria bacterium]
MNRFFKLLFLVLICEGIGFLGTIFTIPSIATWYATLNKPIFNPPDFIFAPVWTTLYFLIGLSLFLILEKKLKKDKNKILVIFSLQLLFNFLWSFIFFGLHNPIFAFVDIAMLWATIVLLIYEFWKHSKLASLLLVPYLLWVSFASFLNLSIIALNR